MCQACDRANIAELDSQVAELGFIARNQGFVLLALVGALVALTYALIRKGVITPGDLVS